MAVYDLKDSKLKISFLDGNHSYKIFSRKKKTVEMALFYIIKFQIISSLILTLSYEVRNINIEYEGTKNSWLARDVKQVLIIENILSKIFKYKV